MPKPESPHPCRLQLRVHEKETSNLADSLSPQRRAQRSMALDTCRKASESSQQRLCQYRDYPCDCPMIDSIALTLPATGARPATFARRGVSARVRVGRAVRRDRHAVTSQFVDPARTTGSLPPRTAPEPPTATGTWR